MVRSSSDYGFSLPHNGQNVRSTFSNARIRQLRAANQTMTDLIAGTSLESVQLRVGRRGGNRHRVRRIGKLLFKVLRRLRGGWPNDRGVGRTARSRAGRRYQPRLLAAPLRGDPSIVGKTVRLNNTQVTIVGVLPASFIGIAAAWRRRSRDVFVPFVIEPQLILFNPGPAGSSAVKPRVEEPTNWWLQIAGRLKPGATIEQVKGNLAGPFEQAARAGMESYFAGAHRRSAQAVSQSARRERRSRTAGAAGRAGNLRSRSHGLPIGVGAWRDCRAVAADRLRERGEPAAVARGRAISRGVGAAVDGGVTAAAGAPAAHGKPVAIGYRRRARHRARLLDQEAAAVRPEHGDRLAGAGVRGRHQHADRA